MNRTDFLHATYRDTTDLETYKKYLQWEQENAVVRKKFQKARDVDAAKSAREEAKAIKLLINGMEFLLLGQMQ